MLWGILAALCWGASDFTARAASVRLGAFRTLLYAQGTSFVGLLVVVHGRTLHTTMATLALGALLGLIYTLGTVLLYDAMTVGQLSVVSPIGSSFAAITLGLSMLSGDTLSPIKLVGLLLTLAGVVLASSPKDEPTEPGATPGPRRARRHARGAAEAVGAACLFGLTFWGLKYVVPSMGLWFPVLESRMMALILLPILARPLRQSIALPPVATWPFLLSIGLIDTCGTVAYNKGIGADVTGVVAVLGSLFSPVTVLLAFFILRERLVGRQWAGVAILFAAVALIGVTQNSGVM